MLSSAKKNHVLLLLIFVVFPFVLTEAARSIIEAGLQPFHVSIGALRAMRVIFTILSIVSFIAPWLIYKGVISFRPKQNWTLFRINPEYAVLIIGYSFLFTPIIYGLLLFFSGIQITEFDYYVAVSVVGMLVWFFLNYRNLKE